MGLPPAARAAASVLAAAAVLAAGSPARAQMGPTAQLLQTVETGPKEALDPLLNQVSFRGGRHAAFAVARMLRNPDPDIRDRAAYVLGVLDVAGTQHALERVIDDSDWSVRQDAIFALGKLRDHHAVRRIAHHLADPQREVRLEAARALVRLADPHAGPALVRALDKVGDDRDFEMVLLRALGKCRWRGARHALEGKLKDGSEAVRLASLRALASMGDRKARLALLARLDAPTPYARVDAARLLGQVPGHWSDGALRAALGDTSPKVRIAAAEALGAHGVELGLRFLVTAVDHGSPDVALAAADALQHLKIPESRLDKLRDKMKREAAAKANKGGAHSGPGPLDVRRPAPAGALPRRPGASRILPGGALRPPRPGTLPPRRPGAAPAPRSGARPPAAATGRPRPSPTKVALAVRGEPLPARLDAISRAFLGVPYLESPLGEGAGYDPDPLVRYDAVDCLTYVDEVLALADSPGPDHLLHTLLDLRYRDGVVAFGHRNHLMMDEWIPDNERKGYVRSIARQVAGADVKVAVKDLTASLWRHRRGVDLPLSVADLPLGVSRLAYVPIARFPSVMDRIPDGTILLVVRTDRPLEPIRVTHVGFVFRVHGKLVLRHAARAIWHAVVDERLADFVRRNALYQGWPVAGFALLEPVPHTGQVAKADEAPGPGR